MLIKSTKLDLPKEDLDYHLIRASMVIIFLFFGYQKWFDYEAQALISLHQPRPLILYVSGFRHQGCAFISGNAEWLLGLYCSYGWAPSAAGFPAMTEGVAFLMKDLVLFAAYLLKQDVVRMARTAKYRDLFTKVKQAVDCFNTSSQ